VPFILGVYVTFIVLSLLGNWNVHFSLSPLITALPQFNLTKSFMAACDQFPVAFSTILSLISWIWIVQRIYRLIFWTEVWDNTWRVWNKRKFDASNSTRNYLPVSLRYDKLKKIINTSVGGTVLTICFGYLIHYIWCLYSVSHLTWNPPRQHVAAFPRYVGLPVIA
jgi:hypothetical protein